MKALILASGKGSRLKPLTDNIPKSLVEVNGKTLIERIIDSLVNEKINKIVITTGFLAEKMEDFVKEKYPKINFDFILNSKYETTNYIYSMWLARDFLKDDDIVYFHGDLFFDSKLIKRIIAFPNSSCLVNKNIVSDKDFNARIENNLVREIGVRIQGEYVRFCLPIYKLLKSDFGRWMKKIDMYINMGKDNCYAEFALNELLSEIKLFPVFFNNEIGMEIDDFEDLKLAEEVSKN